MRRDNRRKQNEGTKTLMYIAGSVVLIIIISIIIGTMMFGNRTEGDVTESQFSTSKISDLVPNIISNQIAEEASSEMGRTVNELENAIENAITTTNQEDNTIQKDTNSIKKEVKNAELAKKEETPDPEQLTDTGVEVQEETEPPVFVKPVEGEIIREFAKDKLIYSDTLQEWITHNGIDIKADKTTIVKSAADGKISSIKNDPRYGLTITIDHGNNFKTIYANLLTAEFVTEGEAVKSGQTIGTVGNTATFEILDDAHLHFEIMQNGEYVDPTIYLK